MGETAAIRAQFRQASGGRRLHERRSTTSSFVSADERCSASDRDGAIELFTLTAAPEFASLDSTRRLALFAATELARAMRAPLAHAKAGLCICYVMRHRLSESSRTLHLWAPARRASLPRAGNPRNGNQIDHVDHLKTRPSTSHALHAATEALNVMD